MTKKSRSRQIKDAADRKAEKVMYALDGLGAAYTRKVGIDPQQACLMVEELPADAAIKQGKRFKYWFTHHEPKINQQEAHPDVQTIFQYALDLIKAHKVADVGAIQALLDGLTDFMKRYEDDVNDHEGTSIQGGAAVQNEIGPAGGSDSGGAS